MSHDLFITPQANQDIEEIMTFYGMEDNGFEHRFMGALRKCFHSLRENPFLSTPLIRDEVRRVFLQKWPYHVYFRIVANQVRVLAIIHTSRDPSYISKRIGTDR